MKVGTRTLPDIAHPAEVVAPQIDQHHVLGPLLGIGQQVLGRAPVPRRRPCRAAGCRRWAGSRCGGPACAPASRARRRPARRPGSLEQHHVGARVDHAQGPVEGERLDAPRHPPAPRQHHLEDVAGGDVLLGLEHGAAVGGAVEARHGRSAAGPEAARHGHARRRPSPPVSSRESRASWLSASRDPHLALDLVGDRQHPLVGVVEEHQVSKRASRATGRSKGSGGPVGQALDQADQVVAEVADEAAGERDRPRARWRCAWSDLVQGVERLAGQISRAARRSTSRRSG